MSSVDPNTLLEGNRPDLHPQKLGQRVPYMPDNNNYETVTTHNGKNKYAKPNLSASARIRKKIKEKRNTDEKEKQVKNAKRIALEIQEAESIPEVPPKEKYIFVKDFNKSILDIKKNVNNPDGLDYFEKELRNMIQDINHKISEIDKLNKTDQITKYELLNIIKPFKIRTGVQTNHLFDIFNKEIKNIEKKV
jgi:hypothetical protein